MRLLLFGDVVGKLGRRAIGQVLPELRAQEKPDLVIANVENLAHGKGITKKTLDELLSFGVDFCTSGNHILAKEGPVLLADGQTPVIRPANFPAATPGRGYARIPVAGSALLIVNLIGTAFFRDGATYGNPFEAVDAILNENDDDDAVLVDCHAEATSEKIAMGWYLDGRVSALFGTHTHVPTADLRILPNGTAYRTDIGMTGARDEVLGVERDIVIHNFLHPDATRAHEWVETGVAQLHAVLVDIDEKSGKASKVSAIDRELIL